MADRKLTINQWAEDDRPREKLARLGASALSTAELLAILIGSGSREESAVDLMRRLLGDCGGSLKALGRLSLHDLTGAANGRYKGLGPAKAITLLAACELARRRMSEEAAAGERLQVRSSVDLYNYFRPLMQDLPYEECRVLLLNQAHYVLEDCMISRGGLAATVVDVRVVLREALLRQATAVALCHNHPSGSPRPSREDDALTERVRKACATMDITLLDHLVLGDGTYYSYCDEGKLP